MFAAPARDETLEQILGRNLAARGGDKFREVKALRLTGRLTFGGGDFSIDAAWGQVQERNGMIRGEVTLHDRRGITERHHPSDRSHEFRSNPPGRDSVRISGRPVSTRSVPIDIWHRAGSARRVVTACRRLWLCRCHP